MFPCTILSISLLMIMLINYWHEIDVSVNCLSLFTFAFCASYMMRKTAACNFPPKWRDLVICEGKLRHETKQQISMKYLFIHRHFLYFFYVIIAIASLLIETESFFPSSLYSLTPRNFLWESKYFSIDLPPHFLKSTPKMSCIMWKNFQLPANQWRWNIVELFIVWGFLFKPGFPCAEICVKNCQFHDLAERGG